jgi:hypothetical protein
MLRKSNFFRQALAIVTVTSIFSIFSSNFMTLAQTESLKVPKRKFSFQQSNFTKCGYKHKKKEINLKFPASSLASQKLGLGGNRVEASQKRCGWYPSIGLTALVPNSNFSTTVAEYPKLFFYIPDANLEGIDAEFSLENEQQEVVYKKIVTLKAKDIDSIISIDLSDSPSFPPLEIAKSYSWGFTLMLDKLDYSENPYVSGAITRVEANSEVNGILEQRLVRKQPSVYAANGIWYESLASLAQLRCTNPDDATIASDWQSLLQQVGLPQIANKPLAQCNPIKG